MRQPDFPTVKEEDFPKETTMWENVMWRHVSSLQIHMARSRASNFFGDFR